MWWWLPGWLLDYQIILKPIFSQLLSSDLMPDHSSPWRIGMPSTNVFEIYSPSPKHSDISSWILVDHWTCRISIDKIPTTSPQKQASLGVIWHMSPSNELRQGWKQKEVCFFCWFETGPVAHQISGSSAEGWREAEHFLSDEIWRKNHNNVLLLRFWNLVCINCIPEN